MSNQFDVIIIGGGVIASSVAYNLLRDGFTGRVALFEQDKVYEYSSTPRSAGGIRQVFSTEINIRMCKYSLEVYKQFDTEMSIDGEPAIIDLKQHGYLFLANEDTLPMFRARADLVKNLDVNVQLLAPEEIKQVIPEINIDDLSGALFSPEDGYMDPYSVLQGYVKKSKSLGAEYVYEKVEQIITDGISRAKGVRTESGQEYYAPVVVNAGGAWSGQISSTIGLEIPVKPLRRQVFHIDPGLPFKKTLPYTFDPNGVQFRHEGPKVIVTMDKDTPFGFEYHWERSFFEEEAWPLLAHRCPNFESLKLERGWAGLYDYNHIDHNAIIGGHPDLEGYYMATGFSGHGLMQAPAAGKGLSELIRLGKYETIDMTSLSVERFKKNQLIIEEAVL
jgi:FAD-dependent oxidoreductase domain-containing protein 1